MPNRSKQGELFHQIIASMHSAMQRCSRDHKDKQIYPYNSQEQLIENLYLWYDEIKTDLDRLKKHLPAYGFTMKDICGYMKNNAIKLVQPETDEVWRSKGTLAPSDFFINARYYEIPNTWYNRRQAILHLKNIPLRFSPKEIQEIVGTIVSALPSSGNNFPKKFREAANLSELYDLWGELIIYAETGEEARNEESSGTNILIASKGEIEKLYPLDLRTAGSSRQVLVNYASTSLISNRFVSDDYPEEWRHYLNTSESDTTIDIVLTCPQTSAEMDAIRFKMKPRHLKGDPRDIIRNNIVELRKRIRETETKVTLYLTDICLPCAYFLNEFHNEEHLSNIKVDLYLPNFSVYDDTIWERDAHLIPPGMGSDAEIRQSFVVENRGRQKEIYRIFKFNIEEIIRHSKRLDISSSLRDEEVEANLQAIIEEFRNTGKNFY